MFYKFPAPFLVTMPPAWRVPGKCSISKKVVVCNLVFPSGKPNREHQISARHFRDSSTLCERRTMVQSTSFAPDAGAVELTSERWFSVVPVYGSKLNIL